MWLGLYAPRQCVIVLWSFFIVLSFNLARSFCLRYIPFCFPFDIFICFYSNYDYNIMLTEVPLFLTFLTFSVCLVSLQWNCMRLSHNKKVKLAIKLYWRHDFLHKKKPVSSQDNDSCFSFVKSVWLMFCDLIKEFRIWIFLVLFVYFTFIMSL